MPVTPLGLREVTAGPVQRPSLVERLGLATAVVDVAVDLHSLFQHVIVPAIRGGATVMDDVFSDDEDATDEGNERAENG